MQSNYYTKLIQLRLGLMKEHIMDFVEYDGKTDPDVMFGVHKFRLSYGVCANLLGIDLQQETTQYSLALCKAYCEKMNIPETAFCIEGNINDFRIDRKNFDLYKNQKRLKFIDFAYDYFVKINSKDPVQS